MFPPPALLQNNKHTSDWVDYISCNNIFNVYGSTAGTVTKKKQASDWVGVRWLGRRWRKHVDLRGVELTRMLRDYQLSYRLFSLAKKT